MNRSFIPFVRAVSLALSLVASLVLAPSACAAEGEPVVVVAEDARTPLVNRLTSELARGGHRASIVDASGDLDFSAEAALRQARVLLRVSPRGDTVNMWTTDSVGHALRFRERLGVAAGDRDPTLLALRAEEAVRGELLAVAPDPTRAPAGVSPASPTSPLTPRFAASVGLALEPGHDGVSTAGGVALGASWLATEHLSLDALARIPVFQPTVSAPEGTAHPAATMLGVGGSLAASSPTAPLRASIGGGVALLWSRVEGIADTSLVSHTEDLFSALFFVRASASLALTNCLRVRADGLAGVAAPPQHVVFLGRQVATLGGPALDAALSLEVVF